MLLACLTQPNKNHYQKRGVGFEVPLGLPPLVPLHPVHEGQLLVVLNELLDLSEVRGGGGEVGVGREVRWDMRGVEGGGGSG